MTTIRTRATRMEWSSASLRLLLAVAETGSFTAAAVDLGYTQSAVSRQIAVLERAADAQLLEHRAGGVRLTAVGAMVLRHASAALNEMDQAERLLRGADPGLGSVRLGVVKSLGAALLPDALAIMRRRMPSVQVISQQASTRALTQSLRAAALDAVLITSRPPYPPPDHQAPSLDLEVLLEGDQVVAVPAGGDLGRDGSVTFAELQDATWISTPGSPNLGVWPALPQPATIGHQAEDWMSKLALVATGWGVTTVPPYLAGLVPANVRLVRVADGPAVPRRVLLARLPDSPSPAIAELAASLREAATSLREAVEHLRLG